MCEIFSKEPDDPFFEEMDPIKKLWWYSSWVAKREMEMERDKYLGILIGSFHNPEAAKKMMKSESPDFVATNEEETFRRLHDFSTAAEQPTKKKRRRRKRKVIRD